MQSILKLGTRKSLLAWAQSGQVARAVEKLNPGVSVQLVGIETRGDRILDIPLRNVEGKEFFVAEIDDALRTGRVDFTVHSLKDLSLDRPVEFVLGAIPARANPRDVILFGPHALERLQQGAPIMVGTSSPRRLENIPNFLKKALPNVSGRDTPTVGFQEIRGNVNTRLSRVKLHPGDPKYLDAVVLAFAGLIRLWSDPAGRAELEKLLEGVRWMVLPLSVCPAAPGQGALAVECRADAHLVRAALAKLHHPQTETQVRNERALLEKAGGGCHQAFGGTQVTHSELGHVLYIRGKSTAGQYWDELQWNSPTPPAGTPVPWDGSLYKAEVAPSQTTSIPDVEGRAVFVAHSRAVLLNSEKDFIKSRVWTSGISSWFKLASRGIWVEGCAEGLGFDYLKEILGESVLDLPPLKAWTVLTHNGGLSEWQNLGMSAISTYEIRFRNQDEAKKHLSEATHVFWSSGSQFDELKEWVNTSVHHASGPGKTAVRLRENGLKPQIFPSVQEWRKWLKV